MKFSIRRKLGMAELVFNDEAERHMEFFSKAAFYFDLPEMCGNCGSRELKVVYRQPQGYEYGQINCLQCKHELKFGQHKENGTMYAKGWAPHYDATQEEDG